MKVIGWIGWDEIEEGFEKSFGGFGGFFNDGMRWKDYAECWDEKGLEYAEALRAAIVHRGLRYTGAQHQCSEDGVPVFDDGTYASFSYRAWGDLLAAVWSEHENTDYNYMDFYC